MHIFTNKINKTTSQYGHKATVSVDIVCIFNIM